MGDDVSTGPADQLREDLTHAVEHLATVQQEYDELLRDPGTIQEDRDSAALMVEHAKRQLESLRVAVAQVDAGTYGRCAVCGDEIAAERLAVLPDVTTCVVCAAR